MKRWLLRLISTALCLCFLAPLHVGCLTYHTNLTLSASAFAPHISLTEHLTDALSEEAPTIPLSAYRVTEETLHSTYSALYATDPSLFYVAAEYSVSCGADGYVDYLRPTYRMTGETRQRAEEDFEKRVTSIVSPIRSLTPLEQVAYLHDYMVTTFTYDNAYRVYDAYSLLTGGRGVCQAYALLFTALLEAVGVESVCVTCFEMSHEWNMVRLGEDWYHIDLIWDDTDTRGEVLHTYFLIGDEELRLRRAARDAAWNTDYTWQAPAVAPALPAAPWRHLTTPFTYPADGTCLFMIGTIRYRLAADLTCEPLTPIDKIAEK